MVFKNWSWILVAFICYTSATASDDILTELLRRVTQDQAESISRAQTSARQYLLQALTVVRNRLIHFHGYHSILLNLVKGLQTREVEPLKVVRDRSFFTSMEPPTVRQLAKVIYSMQGCNEATDYSLSRWEAVLNTIPELSHYLTPVLGVNIGEPEYEIIDKLDRPFVNFLLIAVYYNNLKLTNGLLQGILESYAFIPYSADLVPIIRNVNEAIASQALQNIQLESLSGSISSEDVSSATLKRILSTIVVLSNMEAQFVYQVRLILSAMDLELLGRSSNEDDSFAEWLTAMRQDDYPEDIIEARDDLMEMIRNGSLSTKVDLNTLREDMIGQSPSGRVLGLLARFLVLPPSDPAAVKVYALYSYVKLRELARSESYFIPRSAADISFLLNSFLTIKNKVNFGLVQQINGIFASPDFDWNTMYRDFDFSKYSDPRRLLLDMLKYIRIAYKLQACHVIVINYFVQQNTVNCSVDKSELVYNQLVGSTTPIIPTWSATADISAAIGSAIIPKNCTNGPPFRVIDPDCLVEIIDSKQHAGFITDLLKYNPAPAEKYPFNTRYGVFNAILGDLKTNKYTDEVSEFVISQAMLRLPLNELANLPPKYKLICPEEIEMLSSYAPTTQAPSTSATDSGIHQKSSVKPQLCDNTTQVIDRDSLWKAVNATYDWSRLREILYSEPVFYIEYSSLSAKAAILSAVLESRIKKLNNKDMDLMLVTFSRMQPFTDDGQLPPDVIFLCDEKPSFVPVNENVVVPAGEVKTVQEFSVTEIIPTFTTSSTHTNTIENMHMAETRSTLKYTDATQTQTSSELCKPSEELTLIIDTDALLNSLSADAPKARFLRSRIRSYVIPVTSEMNYTSAEMLKYILDAIRNEMRDARVAVNIEILKSHIQETGPGSERPVTSYTCLPKGLKVSELSYQPRFELKECPYSTCSPGETVTPVIDTDSLFDALRPGAWKSPQVADRVRLYVMPIDPTKYYKKGDVLRDVLRDLLKNVNDTALQQDINAVLNEIGSGGSADERPRTVSVCFPNMYLGELVGAPPPDVKGMCVLPMIDQIPAVGSSRSPAPPNQQMFSSATTPLPRYSLPSSMPLITAAPNQSPLLNNATRKPEMLFPSLSGFAQSMMPLFLSPSSLSTIIPASHSKPAATEENLNLPFSSLTQGLFSSLNAEPNAFPVTSPVSAINKNFSSVLPASILPFLMHNAGLPPLNAVPQSPEEFPATAAMDFSPNTHPDTDLASLPPFETVIRPNYNTQLTLPKDMVHPQNLLQSPVDSNAVAAVKPGTPEVNPALVNPLAPTQAQHNNNIQYNVVSVVSPTAAPAASVSVESSISSNSSPLLFQQYVAISTPSIPQPAGPVASVAPPLVTQPPSAPSQNTIIPSTFPVAQSTNAESGVVPASESNIPGSFAAGLTFNTSGVVYSPSPVQNVPLSASPQVMQTGVIVDTETSAPPSPMLVPYPSQQPLLIIPSNTLTSESSASPSAAHPVMATADAISSQQSYIPGDSIPISPAVIPQSINGMYPEAAPIAAAATADDDASNTLSPSIPHNMIVSVPSLLFQFVSVEPNVTLLTISPAPTASEAPPSTDLNVAPTTPSLQDVTLINTPAQPVYFNPALMNELPAITGAMTQNLRPETNTSSPSVQFIGTPDVPHRPLLSNILPSNSYGYPPAPVQGGVFNYSPSPAADLRSSTSQPIQLSLDSVQPVSSTEDEDSEASGVAIKVDSTNASLWQFQQVSISYPPQSFQSSTVPAAPLINPSAVPSVASEVSAIISNPPGTFQYVAIPSSSPPPVQSSNLQPGNEIPSLPGNAVTAYTTFPYHNASFSVPSPPIYPSNFQSLEQAVPVSPTPSPNPSIAISASESDNSSWSIPPVLLSSLPQQQPVIFQPSGGILVSSPTPAGPTVADSSTSPSPSPVQDMGVSSNHSMQPTIPQTPTAIPIQSLAPSEPSAVVAASATNYNHPIGQEIAGPSPSQTIQPVIPQSPPANPPLAAAGPSVSVAVDSIPNTSPITNQDVGMSPPSQPEQPIIPQSPIVLPTQLPSSSGLGVAISAYSVPSGNPPPGQDISALPPPSRPIQPSVTQPPAVFPIQIPPSTTPTELAVAVAVDSAINNNPFPSLDTGVISPSQPQGLPAPSQISIFQPSGEVPLASAEQIAAAGVAVDSSSNPPELIAQGLPMWYPPQQQEPAVPQSLGKPPSPSALAEPHAAVSVDSATNPPPLPAEEAEIPSPFPPEQPVIADATLGEPNPSSGPPIADSASQPNPSPPQPQELEISPAPILDGSLILPQSNPQAPPNNIAASSPLARPPALPAISPSQSALNTLPVASSNVALSIAEDVGSIKSIQSGLPSSPFSNYPLFPVNFPSLGNLEPVNAGSTGTFGTESETTSSIDSGGIGEATSSIFEGHSSFEKPLFAGPITPNPPQFSSYTPALFSPSSPKPEHVNNGWSEIYSFATSLSPFVRSSVTAPPDLHQSPSPIVPHKVFIPQESPTGDAASASAYQGHPSNAMKPPGDFPASVEQTTPGSFKDSTSSDAFGHTTRTASSGYAASGQDSLTMPSAFQVGSQQGSNPEDKDGEGTSVIGVGNNIAVTSVSEENNLIRETTEIYYNPTEAPEMANIVLNSPMHPNSSIGYMHPPRNASLPGYYELLKWPILLKPEGNRTCYDNRNQVYTSPVLVINITSLFDVINPTAASELDEYLTATYLTSLDTYYKLGDFKFENYISKEEFLRAILQFLLKSEERHDISAPITRILGLIPEMTSTPLNLGALCNYRIYEELPKGTSPKNLTFRYFSSRPCQSGVISYEVTVLTDTDPTKKVKDEMETFSQMASQNRIFENVEWMKLPSQSDFGQLLSNALQSFQDRFGDFYEYLQREISCRLWKTSRIAVQTMCYPTQAPLQLP